MAEQTQRFQVTEIDNALSQKNSFFGGSAAQKIVQFLLLNKRKHTVENIRRTMHTHMLQKGYFNMAATGQAEESTLRQIEKECFIAAVLETVHNVFMLPVVQKSDSETDEQYKGYIADLQLMREYKHLVNKLCRDFGYKAPEYRLLGQDRYRDSNNSIKNIDMGDSAELARELAKFAVDTKNHSDEGYIYPYSFKLERLQLLDDSDKRKFQVNNFKKILLYFSLFAGLMLGIGEAFAPAKFYLSLFTGLGLTGVGLPLAAVAFVAALCVNSILMQGAVYDTFKDLIFKNRLNRDAKGNKLNKSKKILNWFVLGLSVFAALTIAGLSFAFSGFGVVPAAFISLMTFICFKSLLANSVMGLMKKGPINSALSTLKSLITEPFAELKAKKFNFFTKDGVKSLFKLVVNSVSAVAMVGFGASVVAASFVMFSTALAGIPILATVFGTATPLAANVIVGLAELTLGAFFVKNVSNFIDTVRRAILSLPATFVAIKDSLFNTNLPKVESAENYIEHPLRKLRVTIGNLLGTILSGFAVLNAGGFGFGYKALFKNPLVGSLAGISYLMSSIAGNLSPALQKALAGDGLHTYSNMPPVPPMNSYYRSDDDSSQGCTQASDYFGPDADGVELSPRTNSPW